MTPTQRTLAALRADGWTAGVTERWNQHARVRQDLFGFVDILAMKPGMPFLGVQACAAASLSARQHKILAEPRALTWVQAGGRIEIWAWSKKGPKGKRKTWQPTIRVISRPWNPESPTLTNILAEEA